MSSRAAAPHKVTARVAGSGGSSPPATTSDAGRRSLPRSASLTPSISALRSDRVQVRQRLRRAREAAHTLRARCLACGKPIRPWEKQIRLHGDLLHHACATYQPPIP
jgi:hypothetical protein